MSDFAQRKKGDRGVRREKDLTTVSARLAEWVSSKLPNVTDLEVSPLRGGGEGASNETYFFDISYADGGALTTEHLVIRWLPKSGSLFPDADLSRQYRVMSALRNSTVPVPTMLWYEADPSYLGMPFFVMTKAEGIVPAGRMRSEGLFFEAEPTTRTALWNCAVDVVADIHAVDWEAQSLSFLGVPGPGTDALDRQIAECEKLLAWGAGGETFPVYDQALQWLKANTFTPERIALCWGDARPGNLIYRDGGVAAVLDWEMAYLGDPIADLAWFLVLEPTYGWPFGAPPLDGIPDEAATVARYELATGRAVENLFFHKVLELVRLGVLLIPHARNIVRAGIRGYPLDFMTNNVATQGLEALLAQTH